MLHRTKRVYLYTTFSLAVMLLVAITALPSASPVQAAGPISGLVFRDFNANGIRDGVNEIGVPGITVTAYDDAGVVQGSTTTIGDGTYIFNATGPGPYRVEFSGWLATDYPGAQGTASGSSVQFVPSAGAANVNFGLNYPAHYNRGDPRYVGPHASNGSPTHSSNATRPALYSALYNDQTAVPTYPGSLLEVSTQNQVGTLWSLTHNPYTQDLYGSALVRRHAGLGSGGPGAIYQFSNFNPNATGNTASVLYTFPAASVGTVANEATRFPGGGNVLGTEGACFECYNLDPSTFAQVAKAGIGDMDLSDDGRYLYVVTLADRALHRLDVTVSPPTATIIANPPWQSDAGCNGVRRPWATTYYRDEIYVGTVCDATTALLNNTCNFTTPCAALTAQVYIYNPSSNTWSNAFASDIPLTYPRPIIDPGNGANPYWHPWVDDWAIMDPIVANVSDVDFGQPILSDISFDVDGSMLLGFLSRTSLQLGYNAAAPDYVFGDPLEEIIFSGGDILRAGRTGFTGPFTLENAGSVPSPSGTLNTSNLTSFGPGGREFYNDQWGQGQSDLASGSLLVLPGTNQVGSLTIDAFCVGGMGVRFMNMRTGADLAIGRQFYQGATLCNALSAAPGISKASSMGDLELLFDPAPIEIGNRVWFDDNGNGRQDPSEVAMAGVIVTLHDDSGTQITSATTDANGNYLFSSAAGTSTTSFIYGLNTLTPNTNYSIRIDTAQAALMGYNPTVADFNGATGDHHDSDGDTSLYAGFSSVNLTTGGAGQNNHNYDFGFDDGIMFSLGNRVWFDTNDNGTIDGGEVGVNGVSVSLFLDVNSDGTPDTPGTPVATTTTADGGYYRFDGLVANNYVVRIDPSNFTGVGVLSGYTNSTFTETDPNLDVDSNDNGINNADPASNGILSGSITLGPTAVEPIGEADEHSSGQGAPDAQANMTVDFGFYRLSVGNQLWIDSNNNGILDGGENGTLLVGVRVELYDDATLVAVTTTDATGAYLFDRQTDNAGVAAGLGLAPSANYTVRIPASQFAPGQVLAPFYSSVGATSGTDSLDNGIDVPNLPATGIRSAVFSLQPGSPTGGASVTDATATTNNPTLDFGFYTLSLGNLVWLDANNNGIVDGGETGISGVTVNLYRASAPATVIATMPTNATGHYLFTGLDVDDYIVEIVPPAGYLSSTGTNGSLTGPYEPSADPDNDLDNDDNGTTSGAVIRSAPVNLSAGTEPTGETATLGYTDPALDASSNLTVDFGLFVPLRLGNLVWLDVNNNGLAEGTETGVSAVTVELLDSTNTLIATTTTNATGLYLFDNLAADDYIVRIAATQFASGGPLENMVTSTGTNGSATGAYEAAPDPDNNVDNDDNGTRQGSGDVQSLPITLTIGGEPAAGVDGDDTNGNLTVDFGFFEPASLGDYVWYDANMNGIQDAGETGVANVTVTLYNAADDSVVATATTDAAGAYLFDYLIPGDYYVIFATLPAGYAFIPADAGGDDTIDSDANAITGQTGTYSLVAGQHEPTVDAGIAQSNTLRLGNLVWADYNDNGLVDTGEPGISGVNVELYDGVGATLIDSTVTDANGNYMFMNLSPGDYVVRIPASQFAAGGPLENWTSSDAAGVYEPALDPDNNIDNDDNGTTQVSGDVDSLPVTLNLLDEPDTAVDGDDTNGNLTVDFGFVALPASLGDTVWYDTNRNNIQDGGELGVANVTVRLLDSTGTEIATTTTDANGTYLFDNLLPGTYSVVFDISTLPADYRFVAQDVGGDDAFDSDADITTGATIQTTLSAGENDLTWDAGIYQLASIGDIVWYDRNGDGVQDVGEPGIANVTVHLLDSTGTIISTTTTDANGNYGFTDLEPGDYAIEVVPPVGYGFTVQDSPTGTDATDSDIDPTTGRTIVTTLDPGENDPSWDAGLVGVLSLGNFVWNDLDNNGEFDLGESGIPNVTVNLLDPADTLLDTTTTDLNGNYLFSNLVAGDYVVEIVPPTGYTGSTGTNAGLTGPYEPAPDPNTNVNDADTGSWSGLNIRSGRITMLAGAGPINDGDLDADTNLTIDFGLFQPASLGDFVWHDQDRNGIQDLGEPGVANITVTLYDSTNTAIATTTTNTLGAYNFTNLIPGSYSVGFSLLPSTLPEFTTQSMGSDPARDSNADPSTGLTAPVTLAIGEHNSTIDAGLVSANPTAISLQSFTATATAQGITLNWQTLAEWNSRGFHIYRSTTTDFAQAERISSSLITAKGSGSTYQWIDTNADLGETYFYWLAELDTAGQTSVHGPARAQSAPAAAYQTFIPAVMR